MSMSPAAESASPPASLWDRYQPWRRSCEVGFWVVGCISSAVGNSATVMMDIQRAGLADQYPSWGPMVWEWSSNLVLLALVPALLWFTRRFPLHWDNWRQALLLHAAGSVGFSLLHVLGMVAMRHGAYFALGERYDFGHWPTELIYEYLKDARGYVGSVLLIEGYRLLLRRLQGEAHLLDAPDDAPPVEPVERPERFLVRKLGREFLVAAGDIEWAQASGNYVNLHVRGRDYPLRSTIGALVERLDPARFQRVHRSVIVNLDQLAAIEPLDSGEARLHLHDGATLPCSRRYRSELRQRASHDAAAARG